MPTQAVINPPDIKFAKGYLFGTIQGGLADDVPFAELQEITVKFAQSVKEMMGPEQLTAVAVGISEKKVTVTAKSGKFRARTLQMMTGSGVPVFASGVTTISLGVNDNPKPFNLHLKSPLDGSDFEMKLYGCVATDFQIPTKLNDFIYPDFNANVYGDGTNIMQILVPTDQTTS